MSTLYDVSGAMLEVVSAEFTENKIKGLKYYHAVCKCNNNTVLIAKNVTTVDYDIVEDVLNNIYEIPHKYLGNVLQNENNVLVMIGRYRDDTSFYTIYYGYDVDFDSMFDAYKWAHFHNDYAASKYLYTEVRNGHQEKIEFEE